MGQSAIVIHMGHFIEVGIGLVEKTSQTFE